MKPFIVAELSGNHNGGINNAIKLIELAKWAGADAVKIQTYTADTITMDHDSDDFLIKDGLWAGYKLYDLYKEAHTPWEWHEELFNKSKEIGIEIFSSPFDETAVDFLESLNAPRYKIASFELIHHPLIAHVAKTKKPMIMSTGMASIEEIEEAVNVAFNNGCQDLTLLHCVSTYPASIEDSNIKTMLDLRERFPRCKIGLSDHTLGTTVSIAAVALGATFIEKHFTFKRSDGGVDSSFSLEPDELKTLCEDSKDAFLSLGKINYERNELEKSSMRFRRSIYATKDIQEGEAFSKDNIKVIRPGFGIAPKFFPELLLKKSCRSYKLGQPIHTKEIL